MFVNGRENWGVFVSADISIEFSKSSLIKETHINFKGANFQIVECYLVMEQK